MRGKFIVIYGINNLGKSTQAKLLVEKMREDKLKAQYLKYPLYDLSPSGPILNDYLRNGNPFSLGSREAQILYALNRTQYDSQLKTILETGTHVVAEDYIGTSFAWGVGAGVELEFLININSHLLQEDIIFLFDGERFTNAVEKGHRHEDNDELTKKVREVHKRLGKQYHWHLINANNSIEAIHEEIWQKVKPLLQ